MSLGKRNLEDLELLAMHELLVANDALRAVIARHGSMEDIRALAAKSGMTTLLQDGVAKAIAGDTELYQVLSACSRWTFDGAR